MLKSVWNDIMNKCCACGPVQVDMQCTSCSAGFFVPDHMDLSGQTCQRCHEELLMCCAGRSKSTQALSHAIFAERFLQAFAFLHMNAENVMLCMTAY